MRIYWWRGDLVLRPQNDSDTEYLETLRKVLVMPKLGETGPDPAPLEDTDRLGIDGGFIPPTSS